MYDYHIAEAIKPLARDILLVTYLTCVGVIGATLVAAHGHTGVKFETGHTQAARK